MERQGTKGVRNDVGNNVMRVRKTNADSQGDVSYAAQKNECSGEVGNFFHCSLSRRENMCEGKKRETFLTGGPVTKSSNSTK